MLLSLEMIEVMIINNALFGKVEFFNPFLHLYYTMTLNELWSAFMRVKKIHTTYIFF